MVDTRDSTGPTPVSSSDSDGDGVIDVNDDFPSNAMEILDTDNDGQGNNADTDDDNDGVLDTADAFPLITLGGLTDTDGDGRPDVCDAACQAAGMTADDFIPSVYDTGIFDEFDWS